MDIWHNERGFEELVGADIKQSSAIGDYEDAMSKPGSSALWVDGEHYDREDVASIIKHPEDYELEPEVIPHLKAWLETGSLEVS